MELVNLYIWGGIGAAFCLCVGVLIGHCLHERDYAATIKFQADTHTKWCAEHAEELEAVTHSFEFSDKFRKAIVQAMVDHGLWNFDEHGTSPAIMLAMLMKHVAECAIDPKQNQKAKNLYVKGVRVGAKKGREQMRKLMQKSIDNQATVTKYLYISLESAHTREDIYREAVANTLTDKVGLVGVRRAIVQGIAAECTRLRAVEAKKGE